MDKQDLVNNIVRKKFINTYVSRDITADYKKGFNDACDKILSLAKRLDKPQKVKVKQFVADWYEEHKDDLEFSIWKLTIESNDNYTSDRSKMRNWIQYAPNKPYETLLSMKNGYEVEEEPKWIVKVGNLYFCGWEDTTAQFVMNTVLGEDESIIKYKNEGTASSVAKNLGGTVEKV